jgi:hypothetical protein
MSTPKIKGYIFRINYGKYYRDYGKGSTLSREEAHVYTKEDIIRSMKKAREAGMVIWGSKNAGKWIIVYED